MSETSVYSFPTRIDFGLGAVRNVPKWVEANGGKRKALLVTDPGIPSLDLFRTVTGVLDGAGLPWELFDQISPDPLDRDVHAGAEAYRAAGCDIVIALGGGSAMDGAKGIALMATHSGHVVEYDDANDGFHRIDDTVPPIIAIPTTAGTGSEVGRSFVVVDTARNVKVVVFSPFLMPTAAILDPELHVGMPPWLTAATGMDALTHNIEALLSKGFHPMADSIALGGIRFVARSLQRAYADGTDIKARGEMALAASMGATAFQKGLGVIHSLAHPCSTVCRVHHGLANGVLIEAGLRFNRDVAEAPLSRVARAIGLARGATEAAQADAAIEWVVDLRNAVDISGALKDVGVTRGDLPEMRSQAFADVCHQYNPKPVTPADIEHLYETAFEGAPWDAH